MQIVVAIHDRPIWRIPAEQVARLAAARPADQVVHVDDEASRRTAIAGADVLFAYRVADDEVAAAASLRWIHSPSVGVGSLLRPAVVSGPVVVTNSRGVHSVTIAEHAIALTLALRRGLHYAVRHQVAREWRQEEIGARCAGPVAAARLLVIGLGTIGMAVARMAAGLGMRVTAVRRLPDRPKPAGVERVLPTAALGDALGEADAVIVAVPSTPGTRGLIGVRELAAMKRTAVLVNVARGDVIDESALVEALTRGRLAGAGLDVFEREPLPEDHPLWTLPNALISPHIAGLSDDYWTPVVDLFLENLRRFEGKAPLLNVVNKEAGY